MFLIIFRNRIQFELYVTKMSCLDYNDIYTVIQAIQRSAQRKYMKNIVNII